MTPNRTTTPRVATPRAGERRRRCFRLLALVTFVTALVGLVGPTGAWRSSVAAAASPNHAGIIVDLGGGDVKRFVVEFSGSSINGIDALERAGAEPVVRQFTGEGGAVCALCGQGCPADSTCLTCAKGAYWSYWRAPAGASSFSFSRSGAGSVQVHDGDVEGWSWGTGGTPPPFATVAQIEGGPTTTTAPPTTTPSAPPVTTPPTSTAPPAGNAGNGNGSSSGGASGAPATDPNATTTTAASTSTSTIAPASGANGTNHAASASGGPAAPRVGSRADSGSPVGLVAVAAVVGALVIGGAYARRKRRRPRA